MNEDRPGRIQRIMVAVDASPHSLAALEAAVELAALLHAELAGLFVEDIDLLHAAETPFATEFGIYSGRSRRMDREQMEQELRALSALARQALSTVSQRADVRHSFRVIRGVVNTEVLNAAAEVDLVSLGRVGWSLPGQREVGSTARAVLAGAPGLAMVLERGVRLRLPVLVLYDGSPPARKALGLATELVRMRGGRLAVALSANSEDEARALEDEIAGELGRAEISVRYHHLVGAARLNVTQVIRAEGCGLLVIASPDAAREHLALLSSLSQLGCPMLVAR